MLKTRFLDFLPDRPSADPDRNWAYDAGYQTSDPIHDNTDVSLFRSESLNGGAISTFTRATPL